jgi:nucleoid-associated protein YgaU
VRPDRTAPVVLDHGRLAVGLPEVRADRTTVQAILVALLVIAFAAIVLARVASGGIPAGAVESPSARIASQPAGAVSAAPSHPSTSADPTAGASGAGAGASGNPGASGATQTYKVKSGDTLVGIAAKFGTTTKAIADLNGITNPASLKTGQVLKIP